MTDSVKQRLIAAVLITAIGGGGVFLARASSQERAEEKAAQDASKAEAAKAVADKRTVEQIVGDLNAVAGELRAVSGDPQAIFEEKARAELAPKMTPPLKKMVALFGELMDAHPAMREQVAAERWKFLAILSLLGDADATKSLKTSAEGTTADAKPARRMQLMVRWWQAGKDGEARQKVFADVKAASKADPVDRELAEMVSSFTLQSLEHQPLAFEGKTVSGGTFSSADWKGKVVLVDVWATWCGPCIAELPRVVKAYEQWHDKGFEIVGVSCDKEPEKLKTFLAEHKEMPWPQLFDEAKPGWHVLANQWGINGIPTMLLIDKKGVVRTTDARANFEQLIPQLLAE